LLADVVVAVGAVVAVEASREGAEAFPAVEGIFPGEVAISRQVREVFHAAAVTFFPEAVIFLPATLVPLVAELISPVLEVGVFREAVMVLFPPAAVLLDIIVFRTIPRCSPISEDHVRVVAECHRVRLEFNPAANVQRWEEAQRSCPLAIDRVETSEVGPHNSPLAVKAAQEQIEVIFHLDVRVEAMPAIFSEWPAGSRLVLCSTRQSQIDLINFRRIVLVAVNSRLLPSNARIGAGAR
jgi:hypothetical protein